MNIDYFVTKTGWRYDYKRHTKQATKTLLCLSKLRKQSTMKNCFNNRSTSK